MFNTLTTRNLVLGCCFSVICLMTFFRQQGRLASISVLQEISAKREAPTCPSTGSGTFLDLIAAIPEEQGSATLEIIGQACDAVEIRSKQRKKQF